MAGEPGAVSGPASPPRESLWLGSFPPSSPRPSAHRRLCSRTSRVLRTHPTSRDRASHSCPLWGSVRGPARWQADPGISRLPREMLRCVRRVSDHAEYGNPLRYRDASCCLPPVITTSALGRIKFSRLNTRPALSPVNASTTTLRSSPHDSGPTWLAAPSLHETFIHCTSPALPAQPVPLFVHIQVDCLP